MPAVRVARLLLFAQQIDFWRAGPPISAADRRSAGPRGNFRGQKPEPQTLRRLQGQPPTFGHCPHFQDIAKLSNVRSATHVAEGGGLPHVPTTRGRPNDLPILLRRSGVVMSGMSAVDASTTRSLVDSSTPCEGIVRLDLAYIAESRGNAVLRSIVTASARRTSSEPSTCALKVRTVGNAFVNYLHIDSLPVFSDSWRRLGHHNLPSGAVLRSFSVSRRTEQGLCHHSVGWPAGPLSGVALRACVSESCARRLDALPQDELRRRETSR